MNAEVPQAKTVWLMKRNCSFTPKQVGIFYLSMVCFSGLITTYFWLIGAWMVVPFTLIELSVLGIALLIYARHARDYEKITLQNSELVIELNLGYKKSLTQWNAPWVRVKDPESLYDRKKDLVILESGAQTISIGQFILAEKRHDLAKEIRQALSLCLHYNSRMNQQPFKLLALITSVVIISACGKGPDQEPLPRLVKVVVLGQSSEVIQEPGVMKDPGVLRFDASGKVMEVLAKSGDAVLPGQSLARIIPNGVSSESSVMISYRAAKAELQSAEADFKRYTDLKNKNFISASEFDRRVATIESVRAKYEQAIENIGFVTLRALEAGKVSQMNIAVGQVVSNQDVVGKIITDKTSKKIEKNNSNNSNNNNNNPKTTSKTALKIPTTAIHSDGVSVFKLTLDQGSQSTGKISAVKLVLGKIDDQSAELMSGLVVGDIVIATGWHALSEGQQVRIAIAEKAQ
jgi:uncharacterized membrane protein